MGKSRRQADAQEGTQSAANSTGAVEMLTLHIQMDGCPDVWRRLRLPAHFSLRDLHQAIQWTTHFRGYHNHLFTDKNKHVYISQNRKEYADDFDMDIETVHLEHMTLIGDVLTNTGTRLLYEYDSGDGWAFIVKLEKREAAEVDESIRITCVDGDKAGPPEDCGGLPGFDHLRKVCAMPNPKGDDKELMIWLKDMVQNYDPNRFDVENVNRDLATIANPRLIGPGKKHKSPATKGE